MVAVLCRAGRPCDRHNCASPGKETKNEHRPPRHAQQADRLPAVDLRLHRLAPLLLRQAGERDDLVLYPRPARHRVGPLFFSSSVGGERYPPGPISYNAAWILLTFLGVFGIHRFYMGKWLSGIVYLLTGGLLLLG